MDAPFTQPPPVTYYPHNANYFPPHAYPQHFSGYTDDNSQQQQQKKKRRRVSGSDDSDDKKEKDKRSHCRIKLVDIVLEALKDPENTGLEWVQVNSTIQVNWDKFIPYYRIRGRSTARRENIINRFPRKENGFKRDLTTLASTGFDAVYIMPDVQKTSGTLSKSTPNVDTIVTCPPPPIPKNPFIEFLDGDVAQMLSEIQTNDGLIVITKLLDQMQVNTKYSMKDADRKNFELLLQDECKTYFNLQLSVQELCSFLLKFGPLSQSVEKVRSFVSSGAASWYHGIIPRHEAEEALKKQFFETKGYKSPIFLVRSVQPTKFNETHIYGFACSYLKRSDELVDDFIQDDETGIANFQNNFEISHAQLFINKMGQYFLLTNIESALTPYYVSDFSYFLSTLSLFGNANGVRSEQFCALQNPTAEQIRMDLSEIDPSNYVVVPLRNNL